MSDGRPFKGDWCCFGFEREPEPGVDYSWIEVQRGACFSGLASSVPACTILYSSRRSNQFLVRTRTGLEVLWNVSECSFEPLTTDFSILAATRGARVIHISGVTSSFLEILRRWKKITPTETETLTDLSIPSYKIDIPVAAKPGAPDSATPVKEPTGRHPVILTGTGIVQEVSGPLKLTDAGVGVEDWHIDFEDIESVATTQIGRLYVVIGTKSGGTFEIAFDEQDTEEGTMFYEILCKEVQAGQ